MLGLTGTTGKIGGAALEAILDYQLIAQAELVIFTSSSPDDQQFAQLKASGATVRHANYDDPASLKAAFFSTSVDRLFLVSTPNISMDFHDAPYGKGREASHFNVIDAACDAEVRHIFYTSLAFKDGSKAGVMRAHFRTEEYLKSIYEKKGVTYTIIRMGLYNESWPLYLGHYNLENEKREDIVVAGDGQLSWTGIADLGLATAVIITSSEGKLKADYLNRTLFLSQKESKSLAQICGIISPSHTIKVVSEGEYIRYYKDKHKMDEAMLQWWSSTYPSVTQGHCLIQDDLFERLLKEKNRVPVSMESTVKDMLHPTDSQD